MPASPGGSVVDPSLLRQAADRGVTICFADLDGADGLWVPEERTVLVNRGLSEAKVAEVIEHELGHVMIDDQHADLDAGREVLVGRPATWSRRTTVALAAAGLVAVVGGAVYGMSKATGDTPRDRVAPPNGTGLTASEPGGPAPQTTVIKTTGPNGEPVYRTVVLTSTPEAPPPPGGRATPSPGVSATATGSAAQPTPPGTSQAPAGSPSPVTTTSAPPPVVPTTTSPPAVTATPDPTTPDPPTASPSSAATDAGGGTGDTGTGTGAVVDGSQADQIPVGGIPAGGIDPSPAAGSDAALAGSASP